MKFKSFIIAALCTIVQYYDYHLFGFLAARISKHFFASSDSISQLLEAYKIMLLGVLAKPVGALILGRIGDLYGRFATVIISLTGTSAASLLISITPGYEKIGILSAIILLCARMCVSGLVSSGTDGIRIYIFEKIGSKKQCLGNGIITCSTQVGSFLAALSAWFFSQDFMPYYSWRIAFMLGTVMGGLVIYIRLKYVFETDDDNKNDPEFDLYKNVNSIKLAIKNWRIFIPSFLLAGCIGSTYQFIIIFFGTYSFAALKIIDHTTMQFYTSIGVFIYMSFSVIGGMAADYFGKYKVSKIASFILIIITIAIGFEFSRSSINVPLYFSAILALPFITMPALAFLKQAIPPVIRYRIFSLAHAIGSIAISAPTPFLSTYIYQTTSISWLPLIYFVCTIIIMLLSINSLNKRAESS